MTNDEDMKKGQEAGKEEAEEKDFYTLDDWIKKPRTRKEKIWLILKVAVIGILLAICVNYGVKLVSPFMEQLFAPITIDDLSPRQQPPDSKNSK